MLAKWVQIEMGKTLKTMQITTFFFFLFLFSWDVFKGWLLISNSTLHKYLIYWLNQLHVNHKHMSFNLLSLCIIPRSSNLQIILWIQCMNYILSIHTLNNICSYIYCQYSYIDNIFNSTLKMKYPSKLTSLYHFLSMLCLCN